MARFELAHAVEFDILRVRAFSLYVVCTEFLAWFAAPMHEWRLASCYHVVGIYEGRRTLCRATGLGTRNTPANASSCEIAVVNTAAQFGANSCRGPYVYAPPRSRGTAGVSIALP